MYFLVPITVLDASPLMTNLKMSIVDDDKKIEGDDEDRVTTKCEENFTVSRRTV